MTDQGPSKDDLVEAAKLRGLPVSGTKDELAQRIEEHDREATEKMPDVGAIVLYELSDAEAHQYNAERDRLSRFLKGTLGRPLTRVPAVGGQLVPVIVVTADVEGLCGNAQMPGGGTYWVEGISPFVEQED